MRRKQERGRRLGRRESGSVSEHRVRVGVNTSVPTATTQGATLSLT